MSIKEILSKLPNLQREMIMMAFNHRDNRIGLLSVQKGKAGLILYPLVLWKSCYRVFDYSPGDYIRASDLYAFHAYRPAGSSVAIPVY